MNTLKMLATSVVAIAALVAVSSARSDGTQSRADTTVPTYDKPVALDLSFVFHIDQDLAEQDIFVEKQPGSGKVFRPTKSERDMSLPLYAAAQPLEHAPFEPAGVGPWPRGQALGVTLGQWFAAKGHGSYSCTNGKAHINFDFEKLVPNGVYTMWHYFMAWPPTEPFNGTYDLPVGARDGSDAAFQADANGNATFERRFSPCLQLTGEHLAAGLGLAWHSNGKTYGPSPGEFATFTHVQMYLGLPKRSGI